MTDITQDFISLDLEVERVVVNETIKVVAQVEALVQDDQDDTAMRTEIRDTLLRFIPGADWQFANVSRIADPSGVERISLTASTRVSEAENYNLSGRAEDASRAGLRISSATADTSIPESSIRDAERAMRLDILRAAKEELAGINDVMASGSGNDHPYRFSNVMFSAKAVRDYSNRTISKSYAYAATASLEMAGGGAGDVLGNAQKLTLTASIQFARVL